MVVIRGYEPTDLNACRSLWVELTQWHRDIYEAPSIGGADPGRAFDEHLARVGAPNLWVAEVEGEVVGLTGMIPGDGTAELEPVVVAGSHRSRGIGRRLVETVIDHARAHGADELDVRPVARNAEAIRFFHRLGFDVLGHIQMSLELVDRETDRWREGERLAERDFRV